MCSFAMVLWYQDERCANDNCAGMGVQVPRELGLVPEAPGQAVCQEGSGGEAEGHGSVERDMSRRS